MVPVRIMPAQGSVTHSAPLPARADAAVAEEHHERQRQVLRPRRARRRGCDRPAPQFAQDPRRRLAAGYPRADAGNHAGGHAGKLRRGEEPVARRVRHVRPVHRPDRAASISAPAWPRCARGGSRNVATPKHCRNSRRRMVASASPSPNSPACASTCIGIRGGPRSAPMCPKCTTLAAASSRRRWSSSPSARISSAKRC